MNFNTTNMTFRQLMGNGLSYRVPQFQRDYSWDADEWDDLWLDIVGLFGDEPEPAHYMGYLVLQSADSRSFDIIDGQQRMTTLSLLMLAAVSHLNDLAAPDVQEDPQYRRSQQLSSNYIGYLDPDTIAMVSFRYNVIFGRKSNEQEAMYNRIAREVSEDRVVGVATAIEALRPVYPQDAEFRAAFAEKTLRTTSSRNKKLARFILFKLEEKLSGNSFEFESAKYDIEHVLPENPDDDREQFDEQQRDVSTHRLGNMTLLESAENRELGNKGFADKRRVFGESEFAVTRKLAQEFDTWTMDRIRSRQGWMAKQATSIWQVSI